MFASQHFAPQHFAPQHFPPIVDLDQGGSSGGGIEAPSGQRFFVPIARKRLEIFTRLEKVEKKLSAKARRRLNITAQDVDRLDIVTLEQIVAGAVAGLPEGRRVVDPDISRSDFIRPRPILIDPAQDDDLNLRLLLLLGC